VSDRRPSVAPGWTCLGKQHSGCRSSIAGSRMCAWWGSVPGSSSTRTGFLKDRMPAVAKRAGAIGHRRVVDSTGIADSVVTQDTVRLNRTAARLCPNRLAVLDRSAAEQLAGGLRRSDYDTWVSRRSCGTRRPHEPS
jgi:hypothetical protein